MNTTILEPTIHDLHSAHLEPLLVIIERELDAVERKLNSAKQWQKRMTDYEHPVVDSLAHYFNGQYAALMKLRRNLAATQAGAIERETGA